MLRETQIEYNLKKCCQLVHKFTRLAKTNRVKLIQNQITYQFIEQPIYRFINEPFHQLAY